MTHVGIAIYKFQSVYKRLNLSSVRPITAERETGSTTQIKADLGTLPKIA